MPEAPPDNSTAARENAPFSLARSKWAALALVAVLVAQFAYRAEDSLKKESPTWDETMHMDYGLNFLRIGPTFPARDHPYPVPAMLALPLQLSEPEPGQIAAIRTNPGTDTTIELRVVEHPDNLWPPRRMNVALAALGLLIGGLWIGRRYGVGLGLGFVALGSLDPAWIASARYLTTDTAHGVAFLVGSLALVRLREGRRITSILIVGFACGFALSAKASGLVLVPATLLVGLLPPRAADEERWGRRLSRAVAWTVAVAAIGCVSYGALFFVHAVLGLAPWSAGVDHLTAAAAAFVEVRSQEQGTFLLGSYYSTGTWLYFPALIAAKTPVALLAMAVSPVLTRPGRAWVLSNGALFVVPGLFLLVAIVSAVNLGYRHLTPVLPAFWILGAIGLAGLVRAIRVGRLAAATLMLALALEVGLAHPHYLQFTNAAFGGVDNAWKVAVDSSSDWGQDLPLLSSWLAANPPEFGPIHLAYFGLADPLVLGIPHVWRPCMPLGRPRPPNFPAAPCGAPAEILAVSATCLQGAAGGTTRDACYEQLREREPDAVLGGTILVFKCVGIAPPLQ